MSGRCQEDVRRLSRDLEAGLIRVGYLVLSTVGQPVTGKAGEKKRRKWWRQN